MIVRMVKKSVKRGVTNEKIMEVLLDMDERMATKDELERVKNNLERVKAEILEVIEPIGKAVDKDAVSIVNHEKRISVLERRVGVSSK